MSASIGKAEQAANAEAGLRRKAAVLTCAIAIVALVLGAIFGDRGFLRLAEQRQRARELDQEIARLEVESHQLAAEIQALRTEPGAIEKIAREELGLARPDETVFLVPDTEP